MTRALANRSPRTPRRASRTSPPRPRRRVLLTGADSLLGERILRFLLEADWEVVAVSSTRTADTLPPGVIRVVAGRASPAWGDWAAGCTAAVHVGRGLGERPAEDHGGGEVNGRDTTALVAACQRHGIGRVVLVSCLGAAAGAPGARQRAAWEAERVLRASPVSWTILRPGWLAATDSCLPARLARAVREGRLIPLYGGGVDPVPTVAVEDVARVAVRCLTTDETVGRALELTAPNPLPFAGLVRRLNAGLRRRSRTIQVPRRLALPLATLLGRRASALLTRDELLALSTAVSADLSLATSLFDTLSAGLDELLG